MRPFRDIPIKRKLVLIIMSITTAALVLSGLGMLVMDYLVFHRAMQQDVMAQSQIVASNSTAALDFDDPQAATDTLSSLSARPHVVAACIYRPDGALFARYVRSGSNGECPAGRAPDEIRFMDRGLLSRVPILHRGERVGTLAMLNDLGGINERMRLYGQTVGLLVLLSSLLAFLLSAKLQAVITTPISHLVQTARSVSETRDYSLRVAQLSNDELGSLAGDFNRMLVRIQSQDGELREALLAQEAALRQTREIRDSLSTTLASIGDAVISTDAGGRIVFINEIARSLLRLQDAGVSGRLLDEIFQIVNEFSREQVESPVSKVLREGRIVGMEDHTVLIARDGTEIPIDHSGAPIRGENGELRGTVLVFRDVTPRRRADETSRLLAGIVDSTDDAIFSTGLIGIVTSWNRGAEKMFGFTASEMIGKPLTNLAPPDRLGEVTGMLDRVQRGERIEHQTTMRQTNTGELLSISEAVSPMHDPLGRITGVSIVARDISEQVRAAERLAVLNQHLRQSNETLALTNQDLERFAFIASHDLQEPLRMITAYSQLLIKSYQGQFDAEASSFVSTIVEGTRRMRELLADLLAYTEIRARGEETAEVVDLNVVFEQVRLNLKAAIDESQAVLTSDPLPALNAYRGHFQPLLQNLIGNAIKYRGERRPNIHVSAQTVDGELRFAVADNGIGIAAEYHKQIFEVFRRLHGKKISGTGVGLAICQRVVERYGGRIWVESEVGRGSTFLFTLPSTAVQGAGEI